MNTCVIRIIAVTDDPESCPVALLRVVAASSYAAAARKAYAMLNDGELSEYRLVEKVPPAPVDGDLPTAPDTARWYVKERQA